MSKPTIAPAGLGVAAIVPLPRARSRAGCIEGGNAAVRSTHKAMINIAITYAHRGQMDTAFEWLNKSVEEYDQIAGWPGRKSAFAK